MRKKKEEAPRPPKVLGYIRVSTDKQTVENQRFEITNFARANELKVDGWVEETVSGTKEIEKRKLGPLLHELKSGDLLICAELSRLGRSLFMVMEALNYCMRRNIRVWTIKDNYRLGDDITSKVLAFAFGLSAEIERNLIAQRTKEALARLKAEGVKLGRGRGVLNHTVKLCAQADKVRELLASGMSQRSVAKLLNCDRNTLAKFISERLNEPPKLDVESVAAGIKMGLNIEEIAERIQVAPSAVGLLVRRVPALDDLWHATRKAIRAERKARNA